MKEVAHGIDKDCSRLLPAMGHFEQMRMQSNPEAVGIVATAGSFEAKRETFGVAVTAAYADFGASGDRIPCRFGPFDFRLPCH